MSEAFLCPRHVTPSTSPVGLGSCQPWHHPPDILTHRDTLCTSHNRPPQPPPLNQATHHYCILSTNMELQQSPKQKCSVPAKFCGNSLLQLWFLLINTKTLKHENIMMLCIIMGYFTSELNSVSLQIKSVLLISRTQTPTVFFMFLWKTGLEKWSHRIGPGDRAGDQSQTIPFSQGMVLTPNCPLNSFIYSVPNPIQLCNRYSNCADYSDWFFVFFYDHMYSYCRITPCNSHHFSYGDSILWDAATVHTSIKSSFIVILPWQ